MPTNIQTMLLPHKHVRFGSSLLAIAGLVRELLTEPRTVDELWSAVEAKRDSTSINPSFTQVVLALDILFAIEQAEADDDGRVFRSMPRIEKQMERLTLKNTKLASDNETD